MINKLIQVVMIVKIMIVTIITISVKLTIKVMLKTVISQLNSSLKSNRHLQLSHQQLRRSLTQNLMHLVHSPIPSLQYQINHPKQQIH